MITSPHLAILDRIGGNLLLDGARASSLTFGHNEHGPESLRATFDLSMSEAARLFDRAGVPHVVVSGYGETIWTGRVEDVAIVNEGIEITAYGYWRALSDTPYTALWSDTLMENWRVVTSNDTANRSPERYSISLDNQIYIAFVKNTIYGNNDHIAEIQYRIPSESIRGIVEVQFVYSIRIPINWEFRLEYWTGNTLVASALTIFGSGANQTANVTISIPAPYDNVRFRIFNNSGNNYTYALETGEYYAGVGVIRVKTTNEVYVSPDLIVAHLASITAGLSPSTEKIFGTGTDLRNALYEDESAADVLTNLAQFGDNNGSRFEVGVDANRTLFFRPRGWDVRNWSILESDLQIERSLDEFFASAYVVYRDAAGRTLRTTVDTDERAVGEYLDRRAAVQMNTTSNTDANFYRGVFLGDSAQLTPRAQIQTNRLFCTGNTPWPGWMVRAGDYINMRNLPVAPADSSLNKIRRFRISRTEYDAVTGVLTIEPESPLSTLDFLIARNSIGVPTNDV
jgi:hypothetical protein